MMKAKHARRMAAGMACILLCGGCAGKKEEADVYIDENEPDVVISLFTQGEEISEAINDCCSEVINPKSQGNIILYSDYANYYEDEGLSYREHLQKRMECGQSDD